MVINCLCRSLVIINKYNYTKQKKSNGVTSATDKDPILLSGAINYI